MLFRPKIGLITRILWTVHCSSMTTCMPHSEQPTKYEGLVATPKYAATMSFPLIGTVADQPLAKPAHKAAAAVLRNVLSVVSACACITALHGIGPSTFPVRQWNWPFLRHLCRESCHSTSAIATRFQSLSRNCCWPERTAGRGSGRPRVVSREFELMKLPVFMHRAHRT